MSDLTEIFGPGGFNLFKYTEEMASERYLESRRALIDMLLQAIQEAEFKNVDAKEFLIKAFSEMIKGKPAGKAFLQQGEASGQRTRSWAETETLHERNLSIAREIVLCRQTKIKGSRGRLKSLKLEDCINKACETYEISYSTAEDIYKEYKTLAEQEFEYQKMGDQ